MLKRILFTLIAVCFAGAAVAQGANYRIQAGDQLSVEVLEDSSLNRSILVLPDGNISFPLVGTVKASGLTVSQLKGALTTGLAPNFASEPSVFVAIRSVARRATGTTSRRTIEVFLIGEVAKPGSHNITRGTTLLQFLAQSGGFTKFAAKKRIQLRRTNPETGDSKVYKINYKSIEAGKNVSTAMAPLFEGDVIVVPERKLFE